MKEWIWEFASLSYVEWCIKKGLGTSCLRSSVPWAAAIALTRPPNKTLKVSLFGYLISRRIILDLNDLWSEEIKSYYTYFVKLINTNCNKQCFVDFVNPASPSWSDEFRATCDHANFTLKIYFMLVKQNHVGISLYKLLATYS